MLTDLGTGVVTLAAINAAATVANLKLEDLRLVMFGAGSAGAGIADQFNDALKNSGVPEEKAKSQIWCVRSPCPQIAHADIIGSSINRGCY